MSKNLSSANEWNNNTCDKYDYLIAGFCGGIAGLIDVIFVGVPKDSKWVKMSDDAVDELVKKFASISGWNAS